jgi:hypothetical protein
MGDGAHKGSAVGKLFDVLGAAFTRAAGWVTGSGSFRRRSAAYRGPRGNKRFGSFSNRRERWKNIEATLGRWREEEKVRAISPNLATSALPYCRAEGVLTKGERAFWLPLYHAVKGKYQIFCKVRLADVVCCPVGQPDEKNWFRKIAHAHVDFLICHPDSTRPLLVIELDDRSHRNPVQEYRDEWKDEVLRAARLPMYRVPAREAYDLPELAKTIEGMIGEAER